MSKKTYYMVLFDDAQAKGVNFAMPSVLTEEDAKLMMEPGNPTVDRKANGRKYQVNEKMMFNYKNTDGTETLFFICNCSEIKKK